MLKCIFDTDTILTIERYSENISKSSDSDRKSLTFTVNDPSYTLEKLNNIFTIGQHNVVVTNDQQELDSMIINVTHVNMGKVLSQESNAFRFDINITII